MKQLLTLNIHQQILFCGNIFRRNVFVMLALVIFSATLPSCKGSKEVVVTETGLQKSEYLKGDIDKVAILELYINASKAKLLEDYPEAISGFKKVVKLDPTNHAAYYELAVLFYGAGQNEVAKQYSAQAVKLNSNNKWYLILHAEILTNLKQYAEAGKIYEQLINNYPEEFDFYYNWAFSLIRANKLQEAINIYDKLEQRIGIDEDLILQKQKLFINLNKFDKAVSEIQKLIQSDPKEQRYLLILAEMYQANKMTDKANEIYEQLLAIDPQSPYALLNLAEINRNNGNREKYMFYLREAFKNPSLGIDAKIRILFPYLNAFQKNDSIQKAEAIELSGLLPVAHPEDAKSFAMYADFLYQAQQNKEALEQYFLALELDKSVYEIWQQIFFIQSDLKDYDALIKSTNEAMELFPNKPLSYFFNGLANSQTKRYHAAVEMFDAGKELVIKNDPLKLQFYASLGDAYNHLKLYEKSDSAYEAALAIDPNSAYVLNNYSYFLSLRNDRLDDAKRMSAKSLEIEPDSDSYLDTYGWILYKRGEYKDAKKYIEKALEKGGSGSAVIIEHYGDVLYQLDETEKALEQWQKAKELGSDSELLERKISEKRLIE